MAVLAAALLLALRLRRAAVTEAGSSVSEMARLALGLGLAVEAAEQGPPAQLAAVQLPESVAQPDFRRQGGLLVKQQDEQHTEVRGGGSRGCGSYTRNQGCYT